MNFSEWLASTAGTGCLLSGLAWLFRNWIITRLKNAVEHEYKLKLEKYKADLRAETEKQLLELKSFANVEFEKFRVRIGPYSEKQFELYNELWISLAELRQVMDELWHSADQSTLNKFSDKLNTLYRNLEKSALLVEETHYQKLIKFLDIFANFSFGKQTLIDLRNHTKNNCVSNISKKIGELISNNDGHRKELNKVMQNLMDEMRAQLNGNKMNINSKPNL